MEDISKKERGFSVLREEEGGPLLSNHRSTNMVSSLTYRAPSSPRLVIRVEREKSMRINLGMGLVDNVGQVEDAPDG